MSARTEPSSENSFLHLSITMHTEVKKTRKQQTKTKKITHFQLKKEEKEKKVMKEFGQTKNKRKERKEKKRKINMNL